MRPESISIYTYYTVYILRRLILVICLIQLHENPSLTVMIALILTFAMAIHHVMMRHPYNDTISNILDRLCEFTLYLASLI